MKLQSVTLPAGLHPGVVTVGRDCEEILLLECGAILVRTRLKIRLIRNWVEANGVAEEVTDEPQPVEKEPEAPPKSAKR